MDHNMALVLATVEVVAVLFLLFWLLGTASFVDKSKTQFFKVTPFLQNLIIVKSDKRRGSSQKRSSPEQIQGI